MTRLTLLCTITLFLHLTLISQTYVGLTGGGGLGIEEIAKGGIPLEKQINDFLILNTELAFTIRQNQSIIGKIKTPADIYFVRLSYLELPILAKFILPFKDIQPYAEFGLQFGYGLKIWYHYRNDRMWFRNNYSFHNAALNRFDGGILLGAGIEKKLAQRQKLFIRLRHYIGLIDLDQSSNHIYNQGLILSIGCLFPLSSPKN